LPPLVLLVAGGILEEKRLKLSAVLETIAILAYIAHRPQEKKQKRQTKNSPPSSSWVERMNIRCQQPLS
jgi:hypothetical protein